MCRKTDNAEKGGKYTLISRGSLYRDKIIYICMKKEEKADNVIFSQNDGKETTDKMGREEQNVI